MCVDELAREYKIACCNAPGTKKIRLVVSRGCLYGGSEEMVRLDGGLVDRV